MSDTLHKLLEAIEESERLSVSSQDQVGIEGWSEIVELFKKLREEMAK